MTDAADEFRYHIVLPLHEGGQVHLDGSQLDTLIGGVMFRPDQVFARVKQRFAGDAADIQAGAAERRTLLDQGHFNPKLCSAKGADIPARPGADDDQIK